MKLCADLFNCMYLVIRSRHSPTLQSLHLCVSLCSRRSCCHCATQRKNDSVVYPTHCFLSTKLWMKICFFYFFDFPLITPPNTLHKPHTLQPASPWDTLWNYLPCPGSVSSRLANDALSVPPDGLPGLCRELCRLLQTFSQSMAPILLPLTLMIFD